MCFYELAIRQLARPEGTILIRDSKRSQNATLPFDVGSLRIHSYEVSAAKAPALRAILQEAIAAIRAGKSGPSDNQIYEPFHNFIRTWAGLPKGTGLPPGANSTSELTPWQIVLKAEEDAENDRLPKRVIARAHEIVKRRTSVYGKKMKDCSESSLTASKEFFRPPSSNPHRARVSPIALPRRPT